MKKLMKKQNWKPQTDGTTHGLTDDDLPIDEIVIAMAFILIYELLMFLWCMTLPDINKVVVHPPKPKPTPMITKAPTPTPMSIGQEEESTVGHLEEIPEFSAVMYAVEPIGRYYITAYNHLETGSKQTASGATCHEGTITTCAADPRYHKFGEYLEIGGRIYKVEDTGSAVKKRHIDLYFASYKEMARYNSHYETIYRVTFPFGMPKG